MSPINYHSIIAVDICNVREGKILGQYLTPLPLVKFITEQVVKNGDNVLDPSAGDGAFLQYINRSYPSCKLFGIELDMRLYYRMHLEFTKLRHPNLMNSNFFQLHSSLPANFFDCIVGNPPYIRFQRFKEDKKCLSGKIKQMFGINVSGEASSWLYFTLLSLSLLRENGRLAFLVPREILFAKYADGLRRILRKNYSSKILLIEEGCFPFTLQRTGVLVVRKIKKTSLEVHCIKKIGSEGGPITGNGKEFALGSWILNRLTSREINYLESIQNSDMWSRMTDYFDVKASLVTGCKDFFVLTNKEIDIYRLKKKYFLKCLSSPSVIRSPYFTGKDFSRVSRSGADKCWLMKVKKEDVERDPDLRRYIGIGEKLGINKRYKCRIRNPWYVLPEARVPDAFIGHLMHKFPKFANNRAGITAINNSHYVWMKDRYLDSELLVNIFYNYFTLITIELLGKVYGGGNLEINPLETRNIYIPNPEVILGFSYVFKKYSETPISDKMVEEISTQLFKLLEIDIARLKSIYRKLISLRLKDNKISRNRIVTW